MYTEIVDVLLNFSLSLGYGGIILLMAVESSFVPFPSEVVIPPAAYLAQQGRLDILLVIISGIIGSLLGAVINYWLAKTLGRKAVYALVSQRWFKIFLLDEKKLAKAEIYFLRYGRISTFIGRLVPAVRQLISIPAGFSRMNFASFVIYTFFGSGVWVTILAALGYYFGANKESFVRYYHEISYFFFALAFAAVLYLIFRNKSRKKKGVYSD